MVFEGVIDSDYKAEIRVLLINYSARDVVIFNEGDKIAKIGLNEKTPSKFPKREWRRIDLWKEEFSTKRSKTVLGLQ